MYKIKKMLAAIMCGIMCVTSVNIPAFAEPASIDLTQEAIGEEDANVDMTNEQSTENPMQQDSTIPQEANADITTDGTATGKADIDTVGTNGRWEKERTVSGECNGITVYVHGILPYKTELSVKPVNRYKQNNYETIIDGQDAEITREVLTVLDVSLINEYGEEFEPDNTMQVTFAGGSVEDGVADSEKEVEVYHVVDDSINYTGSNATEESFQAMETEDVEASGVTFETDSFSEYVVVLKEGSTTQKEIQVETAGGKEKGFELDKYIVPTGHQKNGNESYVCYLEQAYYNNEQLPIPELPAPQDVIVVFDQSASMSGRVGAALQGLNTFYEALAQGNRTRREKWVNGVYNITDENGDFVDDNTGEKLADHLINLRGVIGYTYKVYTKWSGHVPLEKQEDIDMLNKVSRCDETYMQPYGPSPEGYGVMDMTRTDLAMSRAASLVRSGMEANTTFVLATDGEPYGNGPEGALHYDTATNTKSGLMMTYDNTNSVLTTSRALKDKGATMFAIFMYTRQQALDAVNKGMSTHKIESIGNDDKYLGIKFLSLFSSDYPKNGTMGSGGTFDGSFTSGPGKFGQYVKFPHQAADIAAAFTDIGNNIATMEGGRRSYFGTDSYIFDEISHPFLYDATTPIRVYQVPRIATAPGVFEWGERENITHYVAASVDQNHFVTVRGYDYESNAVTIHNKKANRPGFVETFPSKPGEYGYKLVVEFGIMASKNFGGNNIETNNSETSGFYPGSPQGGYVNNKWVDPEPDWMDNTKLNPDKHDYVELYPVPHVDLNINYEIVGDDINIYAPQMAKLKNILTDEQNLIFYADPEYEDISHQAEDARKAMEAAEKEYIKKGQEVANAKTEAEQIEIMKACAELQKEYDDARILFEEKQAALDAVNTYIPDGNNNAYVDIKYTLKDPDGKTIGTMNIPHGTSYFDENGIATFDWTFPDGIDSNIEKSGKYTITATVTPVTTTRAESYTGSSATGSQKEMTIKKEPKANIFVLEITAGDTRLEKDQAIDFNLGGNNIQAIAGEDKHILSMKWVCLDGVTESNPENEPGKTTNISVGGAVNGTISVPNQNTYIRDNNGTMVVNIEDDKYIPVAVSLYRTGANINKDATPYERSNQQNLYIRDDDKRYNGQSSVRWIHECGIVENCNKFEFTEAQKLNKNGTNPGEQNNVRYLVHVLSNPLPDIHKATSTPAILRTEDIKWTVNLTNNDITKNPKKYSSVFTMVDALPWKGDKRYDDFYNDYKGSQFTGTLRYKTVVVDCSNDPSALKTIKFYTSTDTNARSDERLKVDRAKWTELTGTTSGNKITYSVPSSAIAIRMNATLPFNTNNAGGIKVDMVANLQNTSVQKVDDTYINQARVYNDFSMVDSEPVRTQVLAVFIDGRVWVDTNGNGIRENGDPTVKNVKVGLYKAHNKSGPGGKYTVTINGTQYDRAFDSDGTLIGIYNTGTDGAYRFDNLNPDTYYVIAENIDGIYSVTKKNIGQDKAIDSDADVEQPKAATAFISGIKIATGSSGKDYDIGLIEKRGSIQVHKALDDIYYPVIMSEENRENYQFTATFTLTGNNGHKYSQSIQLSPKNHLEGSITFKDLPFGTYTLTETTVGNYTTSAITASSNRVTIDVSKKTCTIPVNETESDYTVHYTNKKTEPEMHGDQNSCINHLPMHIPINLEIKYAGANPVGNSRLSSYTFKESDFDPKKGGDMIVTYDDGSQISLSKGTLKFNQVTLSPATVTSMDNSSKNSATAITGYYSEKGRTLSDGYNVVVNLKPIHKFRLTFETNGGSFPSGTTSSTRNVMQYGYDETTKKNYAISGTYAEPNTRANYTYAGWNTADDGSGKAYNNETALNAIGADANVSNMTLYAHWKTNVTFDSNGGKMSNGKTTETISWDVNRVASAGGRTASKSMVAPMTKETIHFAFFGWNTKPNGSGTWIDDYGKITKPVTFYAIFFQGEYAYNGTNYMDGSAQELNIPANGWYKIEAWGSQGGNDAHEGGAGGYVSGEVYIKGGTKLYVYVGAPGKTDATGSGAAYNGGANPGNYGVSGAGGGASDVRTVGGAWNDSKSLASRIIVAAGGGGGGCFTGGGPAGGLRGYAGGAGHAGGSQTSGGPNAGFGYGGTPYLDGADGGGGGGGWYGGGAGLGDNGGGGGSSYISGYSGCTTSYTKYTFRNATMLDGKSQMTSPQGVREYGHRGTGFVRVTYLGK